jgi:hypothetical protein
MLRFEVHSRISWAVSPDLASFYQWCGSGSGIRCCFDPGIRDRYFRILDPQPLFLRVFLGKKFCNSLSIGSKFFCTYLFFTVKFVTTKKGKTTTFFPPPLLLLLLVPGWIKIRFRDQGFTARIRYTPFYRILH